MTQMDTNELKSSKKSALTIAGDIMDKPLEPLQWVVADLLRIGRKRISLLLGHPEDGKSSLSRQLAVAVTKDCHSWAAQRCVRQ